jgi:hypothetical protein
MSDIELDQAADRPQRANAMEKHIQTLLTAVILAVLIWSGNSIVTIQTQVARLEVQVLNLTNKLNEFQPGQGARLNDALVMLQRDLDSANRRSEELDRRVRALEIPAPRQGSPR